MNADVSSGVDKDFVKVVRNFDIRRTQTISIFSTKKKRNTSRNVLEGTEDTLGGVNTDFRVDGRLEGQVVSGNRVRLVYILRFFESDREGLNMVEAEVPMSEMHKYATDLRSMSQGRGSFSFEFTRYEQAPQNVADKVIAEAKNED